MCFLPFFSLFFLWFPFFIEIDSINKQFHKYKRKILYCGENKYRSSTNMQYVHIYLYIFQCFRSIVCPFHLKETENVWYHISEKWMLAVIITHVSHKFFHKVPTSQFDRLPIPCANVNMQIIIVFAMCCLAKLSWN